VAVGDKEGGEERRRKRKEGETSRGNGVRKTTFIKTLSLSLEREWSKE
jgi:hypothetical protein